MWTEAPQPRPFPSAPLLQGHTLVITFTPTLYACTNDRVCLVHAVPLPLPLLGAQPSKQLPL